MRRIQISVAIILVLSSVPSWASREVECRVVKAGEPCQWVFKDDPFPPALKPVSKLSPAKKPIAKKTTTRVYQKPAVKVQTPPATIKLIPLIPAKQATVPPSSTTPNIQKQSHPDSLIPSYMNLNTDLSEIRNLKSSSSLSTSQPAAKEMAPQSSESPTLNGYVVEKKVAPKLAVSSRTTKIKRPRWTFSFHFQREKLTPEHSWLTRLSLSEAVQLSEIVAGIIRSEVPPKNAIIALYDPPLKQTGSQFYAALVYILRVSGYAVAGQDIVLPNVHAVRYRITEIDKNTLLVRVKVDKTEVSLSYRRVSPGSLVALTPISTIRRTP